MQQERNVQTQIVSYCHYWPGTIHAQIFFCIHHSFGKIMCTIHVQIFFVFIIHLVKLCVLSMYRYFFVFIIHLVKLCSDNKYVLH